MEPLPEIKSIASGGEPRPLVAICRTGEPPDAFYEGRAARDRGKDADECPYPAGTRDAFEWQAGWSGRSI